MLSTLLISTSRTSTPHRSLHFRDRLAGALALHSHRVLVDQFPAEVGGLALAPMRKSAPFRLTIEQSREGESVETDGEARKRLAGVLVPAIPFVSATLTRDHGPINAPIVRRKPDDHIVHTRMRHRRLDLHPAQIALVPRRIGHCGPGALDVVFTTDQLVRLRHAGDDGGEGGDCTRDGGVVGPREDVRSWDD